VTPTGEGGQLTTRNTSDRTEPGGRGVVPSTGSRLVGIEGLRALAAFSILLYHVWLYSSPSGRFDLGSAVSRLFLTLAYGVTLFFTLSGFLLYRPFATSLLRAAPLPSLATYMKNRALRILPAYWAILLLTSVVLRSALYREPDGSLHNGRLIHAQTLVRAALLVQDYQPRTTLSGIGPAWSLAVEAVFYITLPLLVLLAGALSMRSGSAAARRAAALTPAALLLLIGLSGKAIAAYVVPPVGPFDGYRADWHSVIERSFLCQADLFAFGMALAVLRAEYLDGRIRLPRWWPQAASLLALASALVVAKSTRLGTQLSYSPYNTLMALACAIILALVVMRTPSSQPALLVRLLETRPLVLGGIISYSVFLWHEPLVRWLHDHHLTHSGIGGLQLNLALTAALAVALSALTYRYVEAPALKRKRRRPQEAVELMPVEQREAAP
jgi:peptidoglycan/LPS O-acetylase OafA/YrhL